jgi:hypothetical protein
MLSAPMGSILSRRCPEAVPNLGHVFQHSQFVLGCDWWGFGVIEASMGIPTYNKNMILGTFLFFGFGSKLN